MTTAVVCRKCRGPVLVPANRCPTCGSLRRLTMAPDRRCPACGARKPWMSKGALVYDQAMNVVALISIVGIAGLFALILF